MAPRGINKTGHAADAVSCVAYHDELHFGERAGHGKCLPLYFPSKSSLKSVGNFILSYTVTLNHIKEKAAFLRHNRIPEKRGLKYSY